jgi:hypothetical protein
MTKSLSLINSKWLWLLIFGLSMGLLESAVVVYLRQLYYPAGFSFPLTSMPLHILSVEIFREMATILMLLSVAWLVGRNITDRFAWFLYTFAVWDLFYYLFLYVFLGWPQSLLTWDLLFLIPVAWVSPVLAPIIVSFTFIGLAWKIIQTYNRTQRPYPAISWILFFAGAIVLVISFINDYLSHMLKYVHWTDFWDSNKYSTILQYSTQYLPQSFSWVMFIAGELLLLGSLYAYLSRR